MATTVYSVMFGGMTFARRSRVIYTHAVRKHETLHGHIPRVTQGGQSCGWPFRPVKRVTARPVKTRARGAKVTD
jgi:hypothetical protein